MNWFYKINSEALKDWFVNTGSGARLLQGRKLDPLGTSMRKFHLAQQRLENLRAGNAIGVQDEGQAKADIAAAGLFDRAADRISDLGNRCLDDFARYNIPAANEAYEVHRCLIICTNALKLGNIIYKDFLAFYKEIRVNFTFNTLFANPQLLYFLSYANKTDRDFNPYLALKALKVGDADFAIPIDWNAIKNHYNNAANLVAAVDKYDTTIAGYVAREGRTSFCAALEIIYSPANSVNIVNQLPLTDPLKELLIRISSELLNFQTMELNKIYFGAPGTGKSNRISGYADKNNSVRITFHPDTDYASFVGSYKPTENPANPGMITYKFVPQQFLKAYIKAWESEGDTFLIIEEINRGNCAQIFGDIFQLIERNGDGYSKYPINVDSDLSQYLKDYFEGENAKGGESAAKVQRYLAYFGGDFETIALPSNLHLHATMNTSDQSLFPIDSAFKRRWDWEYVPIEFAGIEAENYRVTIGDAIFNWRAVVEAINNRVETLTESEDKKLGQFFIKSYDNVISEKIFKTKVMFYLWNDVLKDEPKSDERYFFRGKEDIADNDEITFSFSDLFSDRGSILLRQHMNYLGIQPEV